MRLFTFLALVLLCSGSVTAQSLTITSPTYYANAEGSSNNSWPFSSGTRWTYQQLHDDLVGRPRAIHELAFRHDGITSSNSALSLTVTLRLSSSTVQAVNASMTFAANHGVDLAEVLTKQVINWPATTDPPLRPRPFRFILPFSAKPFLYKNTPALCWELRIHAKSGSSGGMDSAYNANQYPGYWRFGTGCKASTQTNNAYCYGNLKQTSATSWTYSIQAKYLVANQNAIWLVGTRKDRWGPFPLPLDLTPLGVTGCTLYTSIALAIPCRTDGSGGLNTSGSPLTIPYDPMLRGLSLYSQCACADPGRAPLPVVFTDGCDNPLHPNTQPLTRILHNSNDLATTASHRYLQRGLVVRFGYK